LEGKILLLSLEGNRSLKNFEEEIIALIRDNNSVTKKYKKEIELVGKLFGHSTVFKKNVS
jgi:hypothetical protein